jgi:hypothetical protein
MQRLATQIQITRGLIEEAENRLRLLKMSTGAPFDPTGNPRLNLWVEYNDENGEMEQKACRILNAPDGKGGLLFHVNKPSSRRIAIANFEHCLHPSTVVGVIIKQNGKREYQANDNSISRHHLQKIRDKYSVFLEERTIYWRLSQSEKLNIKFVFIKNLNGERICDIYEKFERANTQEELENLLTIYNGTIEEDVEDEEDEEEDEGERPKRPRVAAADDDDDDDDDED